MATIPINFVDYGARCDALSWNSNVNCAVCLGRDYDQDEIISNSRPTCFAQDEISSSWLSRTDTIDKDDHHGRIWSWVFFYYHQLPPWPWVVQRNMTFWMFYQRTGATCQGFIGRESCRFTWPRNMPRVPYSFVCVVSDVKAHCL